YKYSNQGGWFGEGKAYTIIKFDTRPDELLQSFENQKADVHAKEYNHIIKELLEDGMDESKLVALSDEFLYKRLARAEYVDILILAYDENTNTLYYFEELK
ncbi:MAG: hypothetical protein K2I78_00635, partial [Clostridia bacterium]|nr:hypothetical protein [Clostridia bacterium]